MYKAWQFGGARKRAAILQKPCAFPQFCSQAFRPELPDACKIVRIASATKKQKSQFL
jgi:hypothetical protein